MNELRGLLIHNLAYITPTTVWFLDDKKLMKMKSQQHNRLKVTFCIHDRFDDEPGSLINVTDLLKSPESLLDVFVRAVIRSMKPLSYKDLILNYDECLKKIQIDEQVLQVNGKHLS